MKLRPLALAFALVFSALYHASAITADELAQFLGIRSWGTTVALPPDSFSADIHEIVDGEVGRLWLRTGNPVSLRTGDRVAKEPEKGLRIVIGPHDGNYKIAVTYRGFITTGVQTEVPLFSDSFTATLPPEITEGDYVLLGETKQNSIADTSVGAFKHGFLLRITKIAPPASGSGVVLDREGTVLAESRDSRLVFPNDALAAQVLGQLTEPAVPAAGQTAHLTLDARLQLLAEQALREAGSGAVVVVDPATGNILAMASAPRVDPAKDDSRDLEMNHAVTAYPAGGAFLPVTALAGALAGHAADTFECTGGVQYGDYLLKCWIDAKQGAHGSLGLADALHASCGAFFYQSGNVAGIDAIDRVGKMLGLGAKTGIPLRGEEGGVLPGPDWLKAVRPGEQWSGPHTANTSIGQGYVKATPLQMAMVAATLANGGVSHQPRLVEEITDAGGVAPKRKAVVRSDLREEGIDEADIETIRRGMWRTVNESGGSGAQARVEGIEVAGRTGTAQFLQGTVKETAGWFIGFAPYEKPRFAICVLVPGAQSGGAVAAPIAAKILTGALSSEELSTPTPVAQATGQLDSTPKTGAESPATAEASVRIPDAMIIAARAGEPEEIAALIHYDQSGAFDASIADKLLDQLVRQRELKAFTVLLDELRKTHYGKDWQPDDALLDELVREERRDFIDAMLARWLDPAGLEARRDLAAAEMAEWITRRAAETRQQRADQDALVAAAGKGDLATIKRLLNAGVDIDCVATREMEWESARSHTPLTLASREEQYEAAKLLLERGAQVDLPKHPGWDYTPLCFAKSVKVAELLKAHGANVNAKLFKRDVSILTYQARFGGADIVQWMLDQGLDPKMIGDNHQNLLFDAGDARTAEILLKAGVDPNHVDEFDRTPLDSAQSGEIAKLLIAAGAKPKADENAIAGMIYNYASASAIEEVIEAAGKIDPAAAQKGLIAAAHGDQAEIAELLLQHGAKADEPGLWGSSDDFPILPLMVCTVHGSPKTAKVLLARGADPNAGERPGMLLQNAIQNGHTEVAKILRDAGAKGVSDLAFFIATEDEAKIVESLASAPGFEEDPDFWDQALPTAARQGHLEAVRAALAKGVPLAPRPEGNAFTAAASEGRHETLAELLAHRQAPHDAAELRQALWQAVWNSHPYDEQRPADAFERCVKMLLGAGALSEDASTRASLMQAAIFTRNPGGNSRVFEMLAAAGADPNPLLGEEEKKQMRLSEIIQASCDQQGCSTPFARTLQTFERLAKVSINRERKPKEK